MRLIFITGANGFTGRHTSAYFHSLGCETYAAKSNLLDSSSLAAELISLRPTHVLHLAGISFVALDDAKEIYLSNVLGTRNLLEALKFVGGLQKVVLASSANVYGNSPVSPLHESLAPAPANDYAVSKLAMEYVARLYLPALPIVIARPFNYTGPGQSPDFLIPKLVSAFKRRDAAIELGNLDVYREFNDVRLLCAAYALLLAHGEAGSVVNVCSGQQYALREVIALLEDLTGHRPEIRVNPVFVRANEVARLGGEPSTLNMLASKHASALPVFTLRDTLALMLDAP